MIRKDLITVELSGKRLDDSVTLLFAGISKSEARRIIDRGGCAVNSTMVRVASRIIKSGDTIEIGVMEQGRFSELTLPEEAILYEDSDLIAVNKPAGINSQRTPYQLKGTLEFWVAEYFRMHGINEPARVIHRLDRGTSGVMVFPKHKKAAAWLSARFHDGAARKLYLALVSHRPANEQWVVDAPIGKSGKSHYAIVAGGRAAQTRFRLLAANTECALLEAAPITGRTHQIRVHLAENGMPIIGDTSYDGAPATRMMLHCSELAFTNDSGVDISLKAPLDGAYKEFMSEKGLFVGHPELLQNFK